jgi:glyoxylase-like metal-dependent hydrolase (beta-lactamase superfamily II)
MTAEAHVLVDGYLSGEDDDRVGSTVGFVRDADVRIVIDPGLVASAGALLDPLRALGVGPDEVTDVVLSHHHPDHTLKAALFPNARVHDHWAWYRDDRWVSREAEGSELSGSVRLTETPGHTPQDISTLVQTPEGLVVFTHLWWTSTYPREDPYATDPEALHRHRARVLGLPGLVRIVPGHGRAFVPGSDTPR